MCDLLSATSSSNVLQNVLNDHSHHKAMQHSCCCPRGVFWFLSCVVFSQLMRSAVTYAIVAMSIVQALLSQQSNVLLGILVCAHASILLLHCTAFWNCSSNVNSLLSAWRFLLSAWRRARFFVVCLEVSTQNSVSDLQGAGKPVCPAERYQDSGGASGVCSGTHPAHCCHLSLSHHF